MNKEYWNLVEGLDIKDQVLLKEETRSAIWKKAYVIAKVLAKKEIKKLEAKEAQEKIKKEREAEADKRKKEKKAEALRKKKEEKKKRAELRAKRKKEREQKKK